MFSVQTARRSGGRDEAEKPFWISFADLMTALMVLFLVAMSVALLAVTTRLSETQKTLSVEEQQRIERHEAITRIRELIKQVVAETPGVHYEKDVVDFGDKARFPFARHTLTHEQARTLRAFAPKLLAIADSPEGRRWIRHIIVEGHTDDVGRYMTNLDLSLMRAQRVLCVLLAVPTPDEQPLSDLQRRAIRRLFLVGGVSLNAPRASAEESRRIELRVEFLGLDEPRERPPIALAGDPEPCPI
jgi:outer membrane protein OmpA-like peptidoglycan-associated protein